MLQVSLRGSVERSIVPPEQRFLCLWCLARSRFYPCHEPVRISLLLP